MNKILKAILPASLILAASVTAHAYNVVNLPESMTLSDAMEIFKPSEITSITVSDIADGRYTSLSKSEIEKFYDTAKDLTVHRTVNPTPFRGLSVNIYSGDTVKSYCLNSGIQIGLYGSENYICYKLSDTDTEKLLYLDDMYWDENTKASGETLHRSTARDFLKMPSAQWSKNFVTEAAAKNLLPYEFTASYSDNITREQFCKLLGNFIAVNGNYTSIEAYMSDRGAYLRNYFEDCANADNSINILYALGIVNGRDSTHFDPHGVITREEAATLLCRTAQQYMQIDTSTSLPYADSQSISEWARYFVTWANENGIMTGVSDTEFNPQGTYTIEQAIATVVRLYNLLH